MLHISYYLLLIREYIYYLHSYARPSPNQIRWFLRARFACPIVQFLDASQFVVKDVPNLAVLVYEGAPPPSTPRLDSTVVVGNAS